MRPTRVRIDRFTQGTVPGALFDEEPEYNGTIDVQIELRQPEPGELGLTLLVLKDLISGELAVGGASAVGRGFFEGSLTLRLDGGRRVPLAPGSDADPDVDRAIDEFWNTPSIGVGK